MSDYKIPMIEPTIDYAKVPPINQKRTVSFINHFITYTVTFLNKFALSCEERLFHFENKLQKLEASLEILESRVRVFLREHSVRRNCKRELSSIPGLEQEHHKDSSNVNENDTSKLEEVEARQGDEPDDSETKPKDEEKEVQSAVKDPRYEKYLKMLHFGVQKEAVKLKLEQEGLDTSILDNPQQVVSIPRLSENDENSGD
ncbi:PREDICTED: WASH complex subunit CCDC53 homolog isoform X1 [Vollenhovia emeryi]|uniref:WASH complex subunit CCDC53 homolog isoform X1 n=1 Tax=Vollenhovia emeryi TaxID=411798 RepID=UPI0005F570AD|nr:PREDICTED: WASH complex subunit CCDC53 homolog isoform X1 [Vollenhovia emeryi]